MTPTLLAIMHVYPVRYLDSSHINEGSLVFMSAERGARRCFLVGLRNQSRVDHHVDWKIYAWHQLPRSLHP